MKNKEVDKMELNYKTMLCKHYLSNNGCSYGDSCRFAHGVLEIKPQTTLNSNSKTIKFPTRNISDNIINKKKYPNPINYKTSLCKNFSKGIIN